jgi:hypothetical protein
MQLRRRSRHQILSLDQLSTDGQYNISDLIADPRPTPGKALEQCELRQFVMKLTGSLPRAQRLAMLFCEWDGVQPIRVCLERNPAVLQGVAAA